MDDELAGIQRRFEQEGVASVLTGMFDAVEKQIDATLLIDNPDIPIITGGLLSVASITGLHFTSNLAALGEFAEEVQFIQRILLGAYCMGYKRGRGKGLTLVVKESDGDSQ